MFSFDPRKVLPPWASLQRLLDGQCDAWSRKDRVHHVLDTSGLSLVDSRPHRGTQQYLVLTKQNLIHRLPGLESLESYALGILQGRGLRFTHQ